MMAKYSKSFVIKSLILLIILVIALSLSLGSTYSRYLTESNHDIGFKAEANPQILLNDTVAGERTLLSISSWDVGVSQINNDFTLKCNAKTQDVSFYLRVFVENKADDNQTETVEITEQVEVTPIEITLSFNDAIYNTTEREVNPNADFYIKNKKEGKLYSFYDNSDVSPKPIESVFTFPAGKETTLDFTLNVYNADINLSDNIYIFIERLK
jgi:hypothetical protein